MSTTTQILFNSPALHSLKREQLVKLCKIHSIKASGKNVELIQKLRQHAQTLPKDSPLSIAARSEEPPVQAQDLQSDAEGQEKEIEDDASSYQSSRPPRPSEQWEMVMDSIEEVEEDSSQSTLSSQRTLNLNGHAGEFGTGSSKSSTVSSSIKALATSLGLKRSYTNSKSTLSSTTSSMTSSAFHPPPIQESSTDELAQMSTPYSSLPEPTYLPQTDHFTLHEAGNRESIGSSGTTADMDSEVLPGHALRPGVPAPPNARLSLGLGLGATPATPSRKAQPTTTIRLVGNPLPSNNNPGGGAFGTSYGSGDFGTPKLKPFTTTFEITFGSPAPSNAGFGFSNLNIPPPRSEDEDVQMRGIYPTLTFGDLPPTIEVKTLDTPALQATSANEDVAMPGALMLNPPSTLATPSKSKSTSNPPSPFVFGTPQHKVTDDQFRAAAAAVLEEMNAKLREDGVDEIASDIIAKLHPDAAKNKALLSPRQIRPLPGSKRGGISEKFDKMHEEEFKKMEGIDEVVRKRVERTSPVKRAAEKEEKVVVGRKRKSSVLERDGGPKGPSVLAGRASNTRVISAGRRAKDKVLPGGFDLDDDDDSTEQSAEAEVEVRGGKRAKMDPDFVPPTAEEQAAEAEEREERRVQLEKEKDALKKKFEANRARRRSSALQGQGHGVLAPRKSVAGRASIGRPRHSVLIKPKPKPSRFGFLSSAKSLVQSVWNRGKAVAPAAPAPASNIPKAVASSSKSDLGKEKKERAKESTASSSKMAPPSLLPAKKSSVVPAKSTAAAAVGKVASGSKTGGLGASSSSSTMSSARSRSPLPSFNSNSTLQSNSSAGTKTSSRMSFVTSTGRNRISSATNAQSGVSSIGTRMSRTSALTNFSNASGVGSMGMKGGNSRSSTTGTRSSSRLSTMTSSRLLAPTASSLAKTAARAGGDNHTAAKRALGPITNSPGLHSSNATRINSPAPSATFSPRQIFSKPVTLGYPSPSGIPVPTPLKRRGHIRGSSQSSTNSNGSAGEGTKAKESTAATAAEATDTGSTRTRSLNGRKPRISRSKVIARLALQREHGSGPSNRVASGSSLASNVSAASGATTSTLAPKPGRASAGGGKTRSSLGAKVARQRARASYAGSDKRLGVRTSSGGAHDSVLMSAKKRVRRSEYARRKSQRISTQSAGVGKLDFGVDGGENRMEVE